MSPIHFYKSFHLLYWQTYTIDSKRGAKSTPLSHHRFVLEENIGQKPDRLMILNLYLLVSDKKKKITLQVAMPITQHAVEKPTVFMVLLSAFDAHIHLSCP